MKTALGWDGKTGRGLEGGLCRWGDGPRWVDGSGAQLG